LPGASEPRLRLLRPQDFRSVFQTALRGLGNRSIVVVGNYEFGPITVEPCRAKARPLRPRRSYFAPTQVHAASARSAWPWVEAPGTAPGSDRFITTAIYRHSRLAPALPNISAHGRWRKSRVARWSVSPARVDVILLRLLPVAGWNVLRIGCADRMGGPGGMITRAQNRRAPLSTCRASGREHV
jgi:hypothetical protein